MADWCILSSGSHSQPSIACHLWQQKPNKAKAWCVAQDIKTTVHRTIGDITLIMFISYISLWFFVANTGPVLQININIVPLALQLMRTWLTWNKSAFLMSMVFKAYESECDVSRRKWELKMKLENFEIYLFKISVYSKTIVDKINMDVTEGSRKWLSWSCKVEVLFHLSEPLFSPLSCLSVCWTEISLQFSLEATLMSHTYLTHQYFTPKPNLLRMTTYHRQDMSFTAATFTFSVFSIFTDPHRHTQVHFSTHPHTTAVYVYDLYFIFHMSHLQISLSWPWIFKFPYFPICTQILELLRGQWCYSIKRNVEHKPFYTASQLFWSCILNSWKSAKFQFSFLRQRILQFTN